MDWVIDWAIDWLIDVLYMYVYYHITAVSGSFALEYAPAIVKDNGPYVIDNSSAFRYDDDIPLVVRLSISQYALYDRRFLRFQW